MSESWEVIIKATLLHEKCCVLGYGGPRFIMMLQTMQGALMSANELIIHLDEMNFHFHQYGPSNRLKNW